MQPMFAFASHLVETWQRDGNANALVAVHLRVGVQVVVGSLRVAIEVGFVAAIHKYVVVNQIAGAPVVVVDAAAISCIQH